MSNQNTYKEKHNKYSSFSFVQENFKMEDEQKYHYDSYLHLPLTVAKHQ